ncbi:NFX1-type zinc finger-containing protein 1 [Homalodisca vitripennis]|nr:NFX1-type zinc finger-containing protein 1 [Homalodisca vitripennis]
MAPLREGIAEYFKDSSLTKEEEEEEEHEEVEPYVFICHDVKILDAYFIDGGKFGHEIEFCNDENWKELCKFGSLLLFTTNSFQTFFSATVIDITHMRLMVRLDPKHYILYDSIYDCQFTVAIPKLHFEPYFHVLSGLQRMGQEQFPMEKYIIKAHTTPKPPAYIAELGLKTYTINGKHCVDISHPSWPKFDSMMFNSSEHLAFRAALTNEFVAIQTPPGTGKTILTLEIVSALLDNVRIDTPILVVCHSNHGLDQLLEGILEKTKKIIRIGTKSRNKKLEQFSINKHRPKQYGYGALAGDMKRLAKQYANKKLLINYAIDDDVSDMVFNERIKQEMRKIEEKIQELEKKLENARHTADISVMRKARVVGMTTTGAARLRPWLNQLGAKIVLMFFSRQLIDHASAKSLHHNWLTSDVRPIGRWVMVGRSASFTKRTNNSTGRLKNYVCKQSNDSSRIEVQMQSSSSHSRFLSSTPVVITM